MRTADLADFWAPVASLTGARVAEARAAAHRRRTTGIDVTAAYTQIPMGGSRYYCILLPQVAYQVMDEADALRYRGFKMPVRRTLRGWYRIKRAGTDFVKSFGAWLQLLRWRVVQEEPPLFAHWQVEDQGSIVRRAVRHKDRIQEAFAQNRNPLIVVPADVATAEEVAAVHDWSRDKATAGTSAKFALMSTYVDGGRRERLVQHQVGRHPDALRERRPGACAAHRGHHPCRIDHERRDLRTWWA